MSWQTFCWTGKFQILPDPLHLAAFRELHRHQQVQVRLPCLGILGNCTWILRVYTRSRRKRPTDTWSLQSRKPWTPRGGNLRASTPRGPARPRTGAPTARAPMPPRPGSTTPAWGSGATVRKGRGARPAHSRTPEGARGGVARRKDARAAAVGEGSPRPGSHSPPSFPARAPGGGPRSGSQPRVSPPEAQRPAGKRGAMDKSARAEGVQRGS